MNKAHGYLAALVATLGVGTLAATGSALASPPAGLAAATPASVTTAESTAQSTAQSAGHEGAARRLHAVLHDAQGNRVGVVDVRALGAGSKVTVHAWGLTPGFHGFHVHAAGICDPAGPKPFASAGGHFNPTGTAEGMQAGAFPVLLAGPDGQATATFVDGNLSPAQLATATGTAVVVHAAPDNYANIPPRYLANGVPGPDAETQLTGDGGARVACAVLVPPTTPPSSSPTMSSPTTSSPTTSSPTTSSQDDDMPDMPGM